eukprot:6206592-Pleurochrysis_carterae.AAC.3
MEVVLPTARRRPSRGEAEGGSYVGCTGARRLAALVCSLQILLLAPIVNLLRTFSAEADERTVGSSLPVRGAKRVLLVIDQASAA